MRTDCDILVIGGGIAGAGVAADLSRDHAVAVLEREEFPGMHATGRSAALHSEVYGNAYIRGLTQASRDFFLRAGGGRAFAQARGCVYIAAEDQVESLEAFASQENVAPVVAPISPDEVRARVPILKSDHVVAALEERHAYDLDVEAIHRFFLKQLKDNGGALHCGVEAGALQRLGDSWILIAGEREFRARTVVNAAGAWGDEIARRAGVRPVGLTPMRRTALIVAPPAGLDPSGWPAVIDIDEQFYFKPEAGKVLISPCDETPVEPCDAFPDELDVAVAVDRVQQAADLPVRRVEHSWAGLRTFAPDRTPVVGYDPDAAGFFWLAGQGGYGIQTSPALSRLAAALVRGEPVPRDLAQRGIHESELSPARFDRGRAAPGADRPSSLSAVSR